MHPASCCHRTACFFARAKRSVAFIGLSLGLVSGAFAEGSNLCTDQAGSISPQCADINLDGKFAGADYEQKLAFKLGWVFSRLDTQLAIQSHQDRSYLHADFEQDLGLHNTGTLPFAELEWQWSPSWRLRLAYQRTAREGEGWLTAYDDNGAFLTQINVATVSHFKSDTLQMGVGYTLAHQGSREVVLLVGAQITQLQAGVRTPDYSDDYHDIGWAPLPDVGLQVRYRLATRWQLEGRAHYFPIRFGRVDGDRRELYAVLEYQPTPGWGLGAGYAYSQLELSYQHERYDANLGFRISGPMLYLAARF